MSKIITLKDGNTIIYPRTISKQVIGDKKEMGDVQGFIDSLVPVVESPYKYYTVRIDLNNPDPETSCTYMDDAVGMTPGYDGWKNEPIIDSIKPCILTDGGEFVGYFLDKEDMSKGYSSTFATEPEFRTDYMIEFPLMGYKLWNDDSYQYVSVTDDPNAEDKGYCYYAHSLNTEKDCDKIYIGAFLGYVDGLILYSDKDKTPTASTSLIDFRNCAASYRGEGYSLISFYPWTLLQCLYVIMYKNLNSQAALGQGYTNADVVDITGTTLSQPFCYGDPNNGIKHVKFLGIEDFYGNLYSWLDGVYSDTSDLLTDYRNSQMINRGHDFQFSTPKGTSDYYEGYIDKIIGTNTSGFTKIYNNNSVGETESTYFSDYSVISPDCFGYCGGNRDFGASAGAFYLLLGDYASGSSPDIGSRLMYKHLASSGGGGGITPEPQGYKLTLLDFDGNKVTELNNVTNVENAIELSGVNLDVTNNVWLNLKYAGVEDESGNEITEINQDTTAYIRYENVGMHKDEAGENELCVTIAWDSDISTYAPDMGQSYIFGSIQAHCMTSSLIKYCITAPGYDNFWQTYSSNSQKWGNSKPVAIEFYIDKNDIYSGYTSNELVITMESNSNNGALTNSDLYIILPKDHTIQQIYLKEFNYEWTEEQIHFICSKSDLQPIIKYIGNPQPC